MCYSKEVSLAVAGVVGSGCGYSWWQFMRVKVAASMKSLQTAQKYMIMTLLFLAGHQLFEFFAILTESPIIYKIGLITSISIMYWLLKSLEAWSGFRLGSRVFAGIIALVGTQMFLKEMTFENRQFYVRGDSHLIWAATWIALYVYWNVCVFI